MADKDFMAPRVRRGGTATEQRLSARVATTDGTRNDAGQGRGQTANDPRIVNQVGGGRGFVNPTNALRHEETETPSPSVTETFTLNFLPNILDNYDTYTYHWKFFITSLENARAGTVLNKESQTIIAESGVSDLTIDHVEFQGIAVPSVEAGTGTQTIVKFEIMEPSGAGLLDKMYYQSLSLGIGNWLVMPVFLQLEFRGRDPLTGESVVDGNPGQLGALKWVWPLKLTGTKASVTKVGTKYEFDAVMYDELAQSNSYFGIQHNIVLGNLSNFQSAMTDLEAKLNADQWEKLIDNYSIPDVYRIVVDEKLQGIKFTMPDMNKSTSRAGDPAEFDKKLASYNTGTSIDKIIDALLGNTEYFQKRLQSAPTRAGEPQTADQMTKQMKTMWRIVTETKPIAYDHLRQDNAVEITIYIVPYSIGALDATPAQTGGGSENLPAAKKRFAEYVNNKVMNKKYNYIFTGLNDQIVNLDLNMNFAFAAILSRFGGIYYDTAGQDKGVSQQEYAALERKSTEELRKTLQLIHNSPSSVEQDKIIADGVQSLKNSGLSKVEIDRRTLLLSKAKPVDRKDLTKTIIAKGGLGFGPDKTPVIPKSLATPTNNGLSFVSDVNIQTPAARQAKAVAESVKRGKLRPIPAREGQNENELGGSMDPTSDAARARTASVFSTALYSTLDASLQTLKLTIKGDPFWLFPRNVPAGALGLNYKSNMPDDVAISEIKRTDIGFPSSVNLFGTDNFIVIRFRTPRIYNSTTDPTDPFTEVETFSGVYKVITITSKFEMGVFTQELSCILDPMINLVDFLKEVEDASKQLDPVITAEANPIPPTSIKAPRILGSADIGVPILGKTITPGSIATAASNVPTPTVLTANEILVRRGINLTGPTGA